MALLRVARGYLKIAIMVDGFSQKTALQLLPVGVIDVILACHRSNGLARFWRWLSGLYLHSHLSLRLMVGAGVIKRGAIMFMW